MTSCAHEIRKIVIDEKLKKAVIKCQSCFEVLHIIQGELVKVDENGEIETK